MYIFFMPGRYKYLGKRVRDIKRKGLDTYKEYKAILRAILKDRFSGKISRKKARGRLLLLYRLTFPSKNKKARSISATKREKLRQLILRAMRKI